MRWFTYRIFVAAVAWRWQQSEGWQVAIDVVAVVHAMEVDDSRRVTKPGLTKLWGLAKQGCMML